jgi:hypothetical protein
MKKGITIEEINNIQPTATYFYMYGNCGGVISGEMFLTILKTNSDYKNIVWQLQG